MIRRLAFLIAGITVVAVSMVYLRWREMDTNHRIHAMEFEKPELRRRFWDCQTRMGWTTTPETIRENINRKAVEMGFPIGARLGKKPENRFARRQSQ